MAFIIFDTEYTTGKNALQTNWGEDGMHRELIQIAALRFEWDNPLEELETFNAYAQPILNPLLSTYCADLTHIEQHDMNIAKSAKRILTEFNYFCANMPMFSNGNDINIMAETAGLQGFLLPFNPIAKCGSLRGVLYKTLEKEIGPFNWEDYPSGRLHELLNIPLNGKVHNALHDCYSIAVTLQELAKRGHRIIIPDLPQHAKW